MRVVRGGGWEEGEGEGGGGGEGGAGGGCLAERRHTPVADDRAICSRLQTRAVSHQTTFSQSLHVVENKLTQLICLVDSSREVNVRCP